MGMIRIYGSGVIMRTINHRKKAFIRFGGKGYFDIDEKELLEHEIKTLKKRFRVVPLSEVNQAPETANIVDLENDTVTENEPAENITAEDKDEAEITIEDVRKMTRPELFKAALGLGLKDEFKSNHGTEFIRKNLINKLKK